MRCHVCCSSCCVTTSTERRVQHDRVILPAYGAGPYLPAIVLERPVYVREMSDGLYSPLAYLTYKVRSRRQGLEGPPLPDSSALSQIMHAQQ